jgi:hypothetical protein
MRNNNPDCYIFIIIIIIIIIIISQIVNKCHNAVDDVITTHNSIQIQKNSTL